MPPWSAENDLKLATAIIALHQVKLSKADCEQLAGIMDCTAKAITHRVQKFRDASSQLNLGSGPSQPATPGTGKKRGRKPADPEGANVEEAEGTPTKKRGRKPANTKGEKVEAAVATPTKKRQPSKVTDVEEDDDAEEGEKTGAKVEVSVKSEAVEEDEG